ncbi:flavodoxin domain-containing protein [Paenibacillus sp. FSL F4-0243]|uniref:flavodoxin domain-containing protein n=1 Tax=Paenibacillus sp. FSL F4-0243 TaxID=2954732 RepID=UPI0030D71188
MKTIIIYTSKYGCTEKAAYLLKNQLDDETEVVNLMHAKEPRLERYDTVILGGSIYFGKIQKQMTEFASKYQNELANKRVGLFICAGAKGEQAIQELKSSFPEKLYNQSITKEVFGDEIYEEKMTALDRVVLRVVKGKNKSVNGLSKETIERFALALKKR